MALSLPSRLVNGFRVWVEKRFTARNMYVFVISMAIFSAFCEFFYVKNPDLTFSSIFGFFALWGFAAVWLFLLVVSSLRGLISYFWGHFRGADDE